MPATRPTGKPVPVGQPLTVENRGDRAVHQRSHDENVYMLRAVASGLAPIVAGALVDDVANPHRWRSSRVGFFPPRGRLQVPSQRSRCGGQQPSSMAAPPLTPRRSAASRPPARRLQRLLVSRRADEIRIDRLDVRRRDADTRTLVARGTRGRRVASHGYQRRYHFRQAAHPRGLRPRDATTKALGEHPGYACIPDWLSTLTSTAAGDSCSLTDPPTQQDVPLDWMRLVLCKVGSCGVSPGVVLPAGPLPPPFRCPPAPAICLCTATGCGIPPSTGDLPVQLDAALIATGK